jgi:hypothetical protein
MPAISIIQCMRLLTGLRVAFIFLFSLMMLFGAAQPAQAQILDWTTGTGGDVCVWTGMLQDGNQGTGVQVEVATLQGIGCLVRNVLAVATTFIGLAAFVMLVMGAFLYLTSGGQDKHIANAKQAITYAIMGLVVALMAFFILNLIATFTGAQGILRFDIFVENGGNQPGGSNQTNPVAPHLAACAADAAKVTCPQPNDETCSGTKATCLYGETVRRLSSGERCPETIRTSAGDYCTCAIKPGKLVPGDVCAP